MATLKQLDDITLEKLTGTPTPKQSKQIVDRELQTKKQSFVLPQIPKVNNTQSQFNNNLAGDNKNIYNSKNPAPSGLVNTLIDRGVKNAKFLKDNPLFLVQQFVLTALNPSPYKVWNPAGIVLSQIPFVGRGNVPNVISPVLLLGRERYEQKQRELKLLKLGNKNLYAKLFDTNQPNYWDDKNRFDPIKNESDKTYSISGDKIVYRRFVNKALDGKKIVNIDSSFASIPAGLKDIGTDSNGNTLYEYTFEKYIEDIDNKIFEIFQSKNANIKYFKTKFTPSNPNKSRFDEEYNRIAKTFYLVSNIKTGSDEPDDIYKPKITDKKIYMYCGFSSDNSLSDSFSVSWNSNDYVGASESIPTYQNTSRSITLDLIIYADRPDAEKIIKKGDGAYVDLSSYITRINWIVQHCYPQYIGSVINKAPILRLTLGNLYVNLPVAIESCTVNWHDVWDTSNSSIIPKIADVSLSLKVIHEASPSNKTIFYSVGRLKS